jgi:hypothetical protein
MDILWGEMSALEARIEGDIDELGATVAPLAELNQSVLAVRLKMDALEEMLRRGSIAAAASATMVEANKAQLRLESHRQEQKRLQKEMRGLREKLRVNSEKQAAQERASLFRRRGDGEAAAKKSALRSAERGTTSLREANSMMMREGKACDRTMSMLVLFFDFHKTMLRVAMFGLVFVFCFLQWNACKQLGGKWRRCRI